MLCLTGRSATATAATAATARPERLALLHAARTHQHRLTLDGCKQWPTTGGDLRHLLAAVGRRPQLRELRFEMEAGEESYLLVVLLPQLRNLRELLSRDAFWRGH